MTVNKTTKKSTTAKKTTKATKRKPSIRKKQAVEKVHAHQFFVLHDGRHLEDYVALAHALADMDWGVFNHHVTDARNDFADWVQEVFNEKKLAASLRETRDQTQTRLIIYAFLVNKYLK